MRSFDHMISGFDKAVRVMAGVTVATRPSPAQAMSCTDLNEQERRHSAGLMRVNHVGEVCAQALYDAQSRFTKNPHIRDQFVQASREEEDHLAWTAERLTELGSHTSLLNPVWYLGAFALGTIAARLGDAHSLGFVVETERQVEAHLASHLTSLPTQDIKSRAIVEQMRVDEMTHGAAAQALGARDTPSPVKQVMAVMAKLMTKTAYYI